MRLTYLSLLLLVAPAFAGAPAKSYDNRERPKTIEDLKRICDKLKTDADAVLTPPAPATCNSFFERAAGWSLDASRKELHNEILGEKGTVAYCKRVQERISKLQKSRAAWGASCKTTSNIQAQKSGNTKVRAQQGLGFVTAEANQDAASTASICADNIATLLSTKTDSKEAEGKGSDTYYKISVDIANKTSDFVNNSTKAEYLVEQGPAECVEASRKYHSLDRVGTMAYFQMSDLTGLEQALARREHDSYRATANMMNAQANKVNKVVDMSATQTSPEPNPYAKPYRQFEDFDDPGEHPTPKAINQPATLAD